MVFNKIEDKLTRLILTVLTAIIVMGIGFTMVRFMPPLFKLLGGIVEVITIWGVIKYLRFEFKKKEVEKVGHMPYLSEEELTDEEIDILYDAFTNPDNPDYIRVFTDDDDEEIKEGE